MGVVVAWKAQRTRRRGWFPKSGQGRCSKPNGDPGRARDSHEPRYGESRRTARTLSYVDWHAIFHLVGFNFEHISRQWSALEELEAEG